MLNSALTKAFSYCLKKPKLRKNEKLMRALMRRMPVAPSIYGPVFVSKPDDFTNRACVLGYYGHELVTLIRKLPRDGVFIDFGANQGLYTILADQWLTEGRVFSFEPARGTFERLITNLRMNGVQRTAAFNFAMGESTELVGFKVTEAHSGGGQLVKAEAATESVLLLNGEEVARAMALDPAKKVMVKIDTEGAELIILRELERVGLLQAIDMFYIELDDQLLGAQGHQMQQVYDLLEANGFVARTDRRERQKHFDEIFERPAA